MQTSLAEQLRARVAQLEAERERVKAEAEKQLFGYATAIGELERLLKQIEEQDHAATS